MRIAITGRKGQVVSSLIERGKVSGDDVIAVGRPQLDLTDGASVRRALSATRPNIIVSAAAYTAVDRAEIEPHLAFSINAQGAGAVAAAASALGVPLIHLSTDYVFDGTASQPYDESAGTSPTGVYGESKLAGEQAVSDACGNSAILRVAWIYSPFGGNFVKTMLRLAGDRDEVGVVADQVGNPTSALDIADGVLAVARNLLASDDKKLRGVFHMTAGGEASWADFAESIFAASADRGGPTATVRRISTAEYPTSAARPTNSRLNCSAIARVHGVSLPDWHGALGTVIDRLLKVST